MVIPARLCGPFELERKSQNTCSDLNIKTTGYYKFGCNNHLGLIVLKLISYD